ncbi:MAG TPA: acyl-CoA dehydrogenase family protein [Gemmatimonadaceae bacterium]|nr:acyl-CoA dehydrogenase family protein [Gemmatimonadaceae bacterium]
MPVGTVLASSELVETAHQIGSTVAAATADAVDREARFPSESIEALRQARMLGAFIPVEFGGMGCSISDLSAICTALGQYCSSTAMVYAMHQIQVACIVRHGKDSPYFQRYLRELAEREGLIASATSEVGIGGDVRSSSCAVERQGENFTLAKQAPVISYGEHTDDILATARRAPDSPSSDQVLVLLRKGQMTLDRMNGWDSLGFRGTCSSGFKLSASGNAEQILPVTYADISSQTMLPVSHIVWTSLWLGIATAAVSWARAFIRAEARKNPGKTPAASVRLAEVVSVLQGMRANVLDTTREYERVMEDTDAMSGIGFAIRMNNLKLAASKVVIDIVSQAMLICGMAGYKNDSQYTLGRHLRDAYGAALMINNDRIYGANASMLLVHKDD